jgi:hypothetical protein
VIHVTTVPAGLESDERHAIRGGQSWLEYMSVADDRPEDDRRTSMDVMATARAIGLVAADGDAVFGTIERDDVLAVLNELSGAHPGNDDLFAEAALRVDLARSAGTELLDADSVFARTRASREVQLRYRSEMAEVFSDLAIDLGLRRAPAGVVPAGDASDAAV